MPASGFMRRVRIGIPAAVTAVLIGTAGFFASASAIAQPYPNRPIRMIIPFAPGGGTDVSGRVAAHFIGEKLGVTLVVENRVGGSGAVALEYVSKAAPDGYTLLFSSPDAMTSMPLIRKNLPFDVQKDFIPLTQTGTADFVFAVNPKVPVTTIEELIALAKSKPGMLRYSSAGNGTTLHVMGEMLKYRTGIDMVHVPYKSGGQAAIDTAAGHVEVISTALLVINNQIKSGQLRPLVISSAQRSTIMPELPTMTERGFANFIATSWFGVFAPKGLPQPLVMKLSDDIAAAASTPEFRARLTATAMNPTVLVRDEFARYIARERENWREVIEAVKITAE